MWIRIRDSIPEPQRWKRHDLLVRLMLGDPVPLLSTAFCYGSIDSQSHTQQEKPLKELIENVKSINLNNKFPNTFSYNVELASIIIIL